MNKWDDGYDEKSDSTIRIIKDYDLVELSLVDSPANQFANIMQVEKVDGVDVVKGQDVSLENVFYDEESGLVMVSEEESVTSPVNGNEMKNIGFVEKTDNEKMDIVKFLVDSAKGIDAKIKKEDNPMAKKTKVEETEVTKSEEIAPEADAVVETTVAEVTEKSEEVEVAEDTVEKSEETPTEEVAKAEESVEAPAAEVAAEVSKSDEAIVEAVAEIKNTITSAFSDLVETVKSLQAEVEMLKSTKVDTAAVKSSLDAVAKDIAATVEHVDKFGKRVDAVEADTAFRKSGDLGEIVQDQPEMVEKSLWGGRFLKTADLFSN
jgi:hypothetical protein